MKTLIQPLTLFVIFTAIFLLPLPLFASNEPKPMADSAIYLKEVVIKEAERTAKSQTGVRTTSINASIIQSTNTETLSELLSENSLIYIKTTGQGALATSSFRGTASNHTQVNWNGISINSPMLGTFDFSQVPSFFTDEVVLYHGNGYQKNGSGTLGGSINLGNKANYQTPFQTKVLLEGGSNNTYTGGVMVGKGGEKFAFRTRGYYQQSDNNYRYLNKVLSKDPFYERRENADYRNGGFMQELYSRLSSVTELNANLWVMAGNRSLPQPITVYSKVTEKHKTLNIRSVANLTTELGRTKIKATLSYLQDFMQYTRGFESTGPGVPQDNRGQSLIAKGESTTQWKRYTLEGGISYRHDWVMADSYEGKQAKRNTVSIHAINRLELSRFLLSLSLLGEQNDHLFMPTFSFGAQANLLPGLVAKGSAGYNYRYPSLNDLYWTPGGNRNLQPEKGFSQDVSLVWNQSVGAVNFKVDATYYHLLIDNWITWMPTDKYYWEPRNISKVRSQGIELMSDLSFRVKKSYYKMILNYGYSPSQNVSKEGSSSYKKQLPYVPLHKSNLRLQYRYEGLSVNYGASYTSERFTTADESFSTNAFLIHDADVSYRFDLKRVGLTAKVRVNNLFDTYYENTQYFPMPLRSFYFTLMMDI